MPIDLTKIPEPLIEAVETGSLVPFIGAGVSRHAKTKDGKGFPTWTEFLQELVDMACRSEWLTPEDEQQIDKLVKRGKYLMAAQALKNVIPEDQLDVYIRRRFDTSNVEVGAIHRALFKLKSPLILTTNYDQLLEKAYAQEFTELPHSSTHSPYNQVAHVLKYRIDLDKPILFHLHGSAERPSDIVFTEMDYRRVYGDARYRMMLSTIFLTKVVLMLGFSFTDPDLMRLVGDLRSMFGKEDLIIFFFLRVKRHGLRTWHYCGDTVLS
jgi:hypothetical protein